ncbi:MAG: LysM peptidoglycan-binding domain-containing protein [Nitrospira sp.]|nr:LysM peptidoglycan-binding domain-containing protein [Nitrospira sp.]
MRHRDGRWLQISVEPTSAYYPTVRVGVLCAVGFASALFAGCGELEPLREPEMAELELTTDTLKASVRDAQRMITELRADLDMRRGELAEAQIARAQLEGRVRETERRIIEARQVIELQREELATVRAKQAHAFQGSFQSQGRKKGLQEPLSGTRHTGSRHEGQKAASLPSGGAMHTSENVMQVSARRNQTSEFSEAAQKARFPNALLSASTDGTSSPELEPQENLPEHVSVNSGDTLWNIAQRYHVKVEHLRTFNHLTDNKIIIGQILRLPDGQPQPGGGADKGTSTP